MTDQYALELRGIARNFGAVVALDNATLLARSGTVHALLGENGAGKTTLMRVAYGLLHPDRGSVVTQGSARTFRSPSDAILAGIGMVQQHPSNVPAMSVWENSLLGGSGMVTPDRARSRVQALAEQIGFALNPDARVADLSVAAQQRLEILKALSKNAQILILDEPTAILAPEEAQELYTWLRGFATRGGTAVVITHKLEEARRFTDELTVLRAGRTVLTGASSSSSAADLTTAMIGESVSAPRTRSPLDGSARVTVRADALTLEDARRVAVVRGATFDVRGGEIVGVAGVEGSGHHELLLALAGRLRSTNGTLDVPLRVGFVPEDRHRDATVLDFTLTENVALSRIGSRRGRMAWRSLDQRVSRMITAFDVRARGPRESFSTLSGGNQQKLVLARELDGNPELLVVENPTRGLDIRAAAFVRDQLRAARDRGAAVVFYSSDLDEIIDMSDRVLVVHAGSVRGIARDRALIGAAMLGAA